MATNSHCIQYEIIEPQPGAVPFSASMSEEDFIHFLKREGFSEKDCDVIRGENIL